MKRTIDRLVDSLIKNMTPTKAKIISFVGGMLIGIGDFVVKGDYVIGDTKYFTNGIPFALVGSVFNYVNSGNVRKALENTGVPIYVGYLIGEIGGYFLKEAPM